MSALARRSADLDTRGTVWLLVTVATIVVLALAPSSLSRYERDLLTTLLLLVGLAEAWNIIGGFGGQFSLVHSAFVGTGAYTVTMLLVKTGLAPALCVILSGVLAAALAAVTAIALLRLRGVYFTVGSLAVALGAQAWMTTWTYTGATSGISIPLRALPTPDGLYQLALLMAVLTVAVAWSVKRSRYGLRLMSVRDDEDAAAGLGVNGMTVKLAAFVLSAFLTGLVGAVLAMQQVNVEPFSAFGLSWTIGMVVMCIVGGLGTVAGPVVGAVVVYYGLQVQLQDYATLGSALTGALLIVVVRFAPDGLVGLGRSVTDGAWRSLKAGRTAPSSPSTIDGAAG